MNIKRQASIIRQMLYLLATIRNGKITQTAEENGIKTSNLSSLLKDLEEFSGTTLLTRKSDGVEATAAGKELFDLALEFEKTLDKFQNIQNQIKKVKTVTFYLPEHLSFDIDSYRGRAQIDKVGTYTDCEVGILEFCPEDTAPETEITRVIIESNQLTINLWVVCKNSKNKNAMRFYKFLVDAMM